MDLLKEFLLGEHSMHSTRHSHLARALRALLVLTSLTFVAPTWAIGYTIIDLGTLGGSSSVVYGMNNKGQVVGQSRTPGDAVGHAFLWNNGVMVDLGESPLWERSNTTALAISDNGQVVGTGEGVAALIWNGVTVTELEKPSGADGCTAFSISPNGGMIAGYCFGWFSSDTQQVSYHAVLWRNGVVNDLGTFGAQNSQAYAVNDNGQVVGEFNNPLDHRSHAFLWSNGATVEIGTLVKSIVPWAINDVGQVTGEFAEVDARGNVIVHAFLYYNGVMTDIGFPVGEGSSHGYSINNKSQVLVKAGNSTSIYSDGRWTELPISINYAYPKINDMGQIAGSGTTYPQRAFLLTPVNFLISLSRADGSIQDQTTITSIEPTDAVSTASGSNIAKLVARVTDQNGNPVPNLGVSITSTVTAYSGGHQHDDTDRHANHAGLLNFPGVAATAQNSTSVITGATDSNGSFAFWFTSPAPAGDHELTASCGGCTQQGPKQVWVGIRYLHPVTSSQNYSLISPNRDVNHPGNHYIQDPSNAQLEELAIRYHTEFPKDPVFYLNDSSLERGGVFDISYNCPPFNSTCSTRPKAWWVWPHSEHRRGVVIDVDSTSMPPQNYNEFKKIANDLGMSVLDETQRRRHFHVRLLGLAQ